MKLDKTSKIYCLFEQSGTFKNIFKQLGYEAFDIDIENKFNQTDYKLDIFKEIEKSFNGKQSFFDNININDLIIAFFPCIYFNQSSFLNLNDSYHNFKNEGNIINIYKRITDRVNKRAAYFNNLLKLIAIVKANDLRIIIENPAQKPSYLLFENNFIKPTIIDYDRTKRGDYFKKPTAYWFINCKPTIGYSFVNNKQTKFIEKCKQSDQPGKCSIERSLISTEYAKNFINDFILGKMINCLKLDFDYD